VEYDLVRFALAIGLERKDKALTVQAYRLWVRGWPREYDAQMDAIEQAPRAWHQDMRSG
jgi:hypothetical protein